MAPRVGGTREGIELGRLGTGHAGEQASLRPSIPIAEKSRAVLRGRVQELEGAAVSNFTGYVFITLPINCSNPGYPCSGSRSGCIFSQM